MNKAPIPTLVPDDGGPAFPLHDAMKMEPATADEWKRLTAGMSLRDYFAAKAMQAIIIGNNADECALGIGSAKDAYRMADAMLIARELRS